MVRIKSLRMINFGGYRDTTFNFDAQQQPVALLYGPNGFGKSTVLEALRICGNPLVFEGREKGPSLYLRPWIYDPCFVAGADLVVQNKAKLVIDAVFADENEDEYNVVLSNNGFLLNELPPLHNGHVFYADADHPINWSKFQLHSEHAGKFIELAEAIYGFETDLDHDVTDKIREYDGTKTQHKFFQNVVIRKGKDRVPFARMSAGEKKIATLVRQLCDPDNLDGRNIVLIDNLDLHVYFARHPIMIDRLTKYFSKHQFIITCHSHTMIKHVEATYGDQCLYDVQKIKGVLFKELETVQKKA
jgi:hypothetical protein